MKRDRTDPQAPPKTEHDQRYERARVAWNLPRPAGKPLSLATERVARRQPPDPEVPPAA
jgi:hypothetical protein